MLQYGYENVTYLLSMEGYRIR